MSGAARCPLLAKGELPDPERTGIFTTAIVSIVEDQPIALFFTGRKHAGEHLTALMDQRATGLAAPILMSDALDRNVPKGHAVVEANCLAHGRRHVVDEVANFPPECTHLLVLLGKVFRVDHPCRRYRLSAELDGGGETLVVWGGAMSMNGTWVSPDGTLEQFAVAGSVLAVAAAAAWTGSGFLVGWVGYSDRAIHLGTLSPGGTALTGDHMVVDDLYKLDIAAGDGTHLVVWSRYIDQFTHSNYQVVALRVDDDGTPLDAMPLELSAELDTKIDPNPHVMFDGTNFRVTWSQPGAGGPTAFMVRVGDDGEILDPVPVQAVPGVPRARSASFTPAPEGKLLVTYLLRDLAMGATDRVRARLIDAQ